MIKNGKNINFHILGINNDKPKWNYDFYKEMLICKMSLNFSRGKPLKYASSIRIASYMGNGILTFINEKDNYFNLSFEEQLEWCLKNGLYRDIIDFIQGWIEVEKFKKFPGKILILTQEELVTKKDFFFKQLMNFYNIDDNKYSIPNDPKFNSKTSYRKGSINEWKTVFNNSQKEYALNLITKDMRERFKWS